MSTISSTINAKTAKNLKINNKVGKMTDSWLPVDIDWSEAAGMRGSVPTKDNPIARLARGDIPAVIVRKKSKHG